LNGVRVKTKTGSSEAKSYPHSGFYSDPSY
jgi:hypothetical protein